MTDDRARRIRNLRNRTAQSRSNGDDSETDSSADETTPDNQAETETDDPDTGSESPSAVNGSPSPASETATEPAATDTSDGVDHDAGETLTYDEPETPALGATGDASVATAGEEPSPIVETDSDDSSPFGGAIADESVLSDFVDDVGTGGNADGSVATLGAGQEVAGRGAGVFDQDETLVASAHDGDETVQMLEFYLNDNRYAIEIERISAIVEMKRITRFPRGPEPIDGVTDLRGEITAVLDPTALLDVERNELTDDQYIVVLERDDDKQKLGIRVTDVLQAVTYRQSQIDETGSVMDSAEHQHEFINGIIKKTTDDRTSLVTWLDIDEIIENTN